MWREWIRRKSDVTLSHILILRHLTLDPLRPQQVQILPSLISSSSLLVTMAINQTLV
jgi:hypothetical protein